MLTDETEESEAVESSNPVEIAEEPQEELNLEIPDELYNQISDMPEVLRYIKKLERLVAQQRKKIQKLQRKLTKKVTTSTETQTGDDAPKKGIAEEITEAAESAVARQGFVYEETSGLYYDYNSGYYYNAEYGLYYDGNTGTYLSYDTEKQEYVFHSQVERPPETVYNENDKRIKNTGQSQVITSSTMENLSDSLNTMNINALQEQALEISQQWPPCIRIIVEETNIPNIKSGSLHVITYDGGTIGREGKHDILLPDINVSKHHLKFTFDKTLDKYFVTDLGSRNGTLLNNKRMCSSKQESEPMEVPHGTRIQIGSTILLCHVHAGSQTCGLCEPGLIQPKDSAVRLVKSKDKQALHKQELKNLKKKFAFGQNAPNGNVGAGYTDRAQVRRETVGSHNEHEKTQSASLDQSIPSENKGFKLLAKMGWSEGQSLGKDGKGRVEPVELISNPGTAGMGSGSEPFSSAAVKLDTAKSDIWNKVRERYQQISTKEESDSDS